MNLKATHILLIREPDEETCRKRALNFFAKNFLVKYDSVNIAEDRSFRADKPEFWEIIDGGINNNRKVLAKLVGELQESGFEKITDLAQMDQGYQSKTLHTITHLLDGFFGIDTSFYSLEEDSHWLSEQLGAIIREQPCDFRVLTVECSSEAGTSTDLLAKIRKFESGF
ncbi:MAG: hypothetical protein ABFS18_10165 [Thermodesulfobacteriota bacterium]